MYTIDILVFVSILDTSYLRTGVYGITGMQENYKDDL